MDVKRGRVRFSSSRFYTQVQKGRRMNTRIFELPLMVLALGSFALQHLVCVNWALNHGVFSFLSFSLYIYLFSRFFKHRRPGSQRQLWTLRSNPGPALDKWKHCFLWWWPFTHYSFWIWGRGIVCEPSYTVPLFWR